MVRQQEHPTLLENPHFSFLYAGDSSVNSLVAEDKSEKWFNIHYPQFNATIFCTYIPLKDHNLSKILEESYQLAYSHVSMAQGIQQTQFIDSIRHAYGLIYDIKGTVASPIQFYVTDNTSNFLRGSLYFDDIVKPDSVASIVSSLREDIVHIIESVKWKQR